MIGLAIFASGGTPPAPVITSITPTTGDDTGGTAITNLHGTGFATGCVVTFDGVPATGVVRVNSTKVTCVTPAGTGVVDVLVTNPDTQDSGASGDGIYTYVAAGASDPSGMNLTGWWRADGSNYAGSPWTPTASAGTSGAAGNLTSGSPMTTGATVNGFVSASNDGTNTLANASNVDAFVSTGAGAFVALVYLDSVGADAGAGIAVLNGDGVMGTSGAAFIGMSFSASGLRSFLNDGGYAEPAAIALSTGAWHMVMMRWDGATFEQSVDAGTPTSVGTTGPALLAFPLEIGRSFGGIMAGDVLEIILAPVLTDVNLTNIKSYFNTRYALSL